jgi:hypothetical protein
MLAFLSPLLTTAEVSKNVEPQESCRERRLAMSIPN